ncbi:MAG: NAD(P)H-dependent oxidoreductase [Sphaerochaetaceae bacterium]|nr:NAD(P)H-dependent oxidoreductase [Sphaerochaetaceae bacterium]
MKSLVVYYSLTETGNTRVVAEKIAKIAGADIVRIEPEISYPADYDSLCKVAKSEIDANIHPKIKPVNVHMSEYDLVYVGFPIWYRTYPRVIASFIDQADLTGKKVKPFCTNEEGAFGIADFELGSAVKMKGGSLEKGIAVKSFNVAESDEALKKWIG